MQPICTHKISLQSSKPSHSYPIIRLPREFRALTGSKAKIYQTSHYGKLAFLITTDEKVDNCCATTPELEYEDHVKDLESRIEDLENTIFNNKDFIGVKIEKDKKIKGRGRDSNPRRGLHRAIGLPGYPTSAYIFDSPVRIRTAVAGFLLPAADIKPRASKGPHD